MSDSARNIARRAEAARITRMMRENCPFSFLRLGDGDLNWMLMMQEGKAAPRYRYNDDAKASVQTAYSVTGMEPRHYDRLRHALEHCSYLDFYEGYPYSAENLPRLKLDRDPSLARNPDAQTSIIFYDWARYEMRPYMAGRRCLFASAESSLLEQLYSEPAYRKLVAEYWPDDAHIFFHQVHNNGRNYSEHLDRIKEEIRRDVREHRVDTLFIALASGAKIIGYELSIEENIRVFDLGSITRALTYSGSPGYHAFRSFHNPFLFRVPLDVYMRALQRAAPDMPLVTLAGKAHAQLALELQRKEVGTSYSSDVVDPSAQDISPENLAHFRQALAVYRRDIRPRVRADADARRLDDEFSLWMLKKGIGIKGRLFRAAVRAKGLLRRVLSGGGTA